MRTTIVEHIARLTLVSTTLRSRMLHSASSHPPSIRDVKILSNSASFFLQDCPLLQRKNRLLRGCARL